MKKQASATKGAKKDKKFIQKMQFHFMLAASIFFVFKACSLMSVLALPQGTAYVLTPRGLGIVLDLIVSVVIIAAALLVYNLITAGKFFKSTLAKAIVFFALFVGLAYFHGAKYVAVVKTGSSFVFVRPLPWDKKILGEKNLQTKINDSGIVRELEIKTAGESIHCRPVYSIDVETLQILDELTRELGCFR